MFLCSFYLPVYFSSKKNEVEYKYIISINIFVVSF